MASRSNPYPMGVSDPFPAGRVISFGSLEFRATGNGYLMQLLSSERDLIASTTPARRNRRSGQRSRQARAERRRAARHSSPTWVEAGMSQLSIEANGATVPPSRASASSVPAPSSAAALVPPRVGSTSPSPFPFGMRNTAARTYASSISTNFAEHEDLPGHHLLSIRNLIASSLDESYPEAASSIADDVNFFMNNFAAEEAEDYSGVYDPDALRSFQLATAYCLTCSEDSSEGDFDPSRECFMADLADEQNDNAPSNGADGGADAQANQPVVPPAAPSTSSSAARQAQLAQLNELQAKLDEQRQQTQELRAALEQ